MAFGRAAALPSAAPRYSPYTKPAPPASGKACFCCGDASHQKANCPLKATVCDACGKVGHVEAMCEAGQKDRKKCFACGGDHEKVDCPNIDEICENCGKQGHMKATCEAVKGCYACGGDHMKVDCPHKHKTCDACGKVGHLKSRCEHVTGKGGKDGCYACGGDHLKAQCPNRYKTCDECGKVGHLKAKCELLSQTQGTNTAGGAVAKGCFACGGHHQKAQCPHLSKTCDICGKVGHLKAMCESSKSATTGLGAQAARRTCYACGGNHEKAQCVHKGKTCDLCGKVGHLKIMCESSGPAAGDKGVRGVKGGIGGAPRKCYCCGSADHQKANCIFKTATCGVCGKLGHLQAMCSK